MGFGRFIKGVALAVGLLAAVPSLARAEDGAAAFIRNLGQEALTIIRSQDGMAERRSHFAELFVKGFDVPAIGKFVLGRYWRAATPEEQARYLDLFGRYIVAVYADRFSNYSGEGFDVLGSQPGQNGESVVSSQITRPSGGQPIRIDWRVLGTQDSYKIADVVVEGVSMTVTQRQEFSSVIGQNGGKVQALIDVLEKRVGQPG